MTARSGDRGKAVSHIGKAYPDRVEVRGRDLCGDLMGRLSFTEYFHLLLTGREPTDDQRFFLDLLLVAIAEHGLMPTNIAARMTLAADPGSLQGAVAAGILGAGPVILGTSESCAQLLEEAQKEVASGGTPSRRTRGRSTVTVSANQIRYVFFHLPQQSNHLRGRQDPARRHAQLERRERSGGRSRSGPALRRAPARGGLA